MNDAPGLTRVTKGRTVWAGFVSIVDGVKVPTHRTGMVVKANPTSCLVLWEGDKYATAHTCGEVTVLDLRSRPPSDERSLIA